MKHNNVNYISNKKKKKQKKMLLIKNKFFNKCLTQLKKYYINAVAIFEMNFNIFTIWMHSYMRFDNLTNQIINFFNR